MTTTLCVHGHRPDKLGGWAQPNQVSQYIFDEIKMILSGNRPNIMERPSMVFIGGDLGVPQWAGRACKELSIPYQVVIPFGNFSSKWPPHAQAIFKDLCKNAHNVVNVSGNKDYSGGEIYRRNKYMCQMADKVMVIWDGSAGVTAQLATYALNSNKLVHLTLPDMIKEAASTAYQAALMKKNHPPKQFSPILQPDPQATQKILNIMDALMGKSPTESEPPKLFWGDESANSAVPDQEEDATLSERLSPKRVVEID